MTTENGKTLTMDAKSKPAEIWATIASKWWDRTDGGKKKNRFLTIPCHMSDGAVVVGKYSEADGVGTITLYREFFNKAVPAASKPAF